MRFKEHRDSPCKGGCGLPVSGTTTSGAVKGKTPSLALEPPGATKRQVFTPCTGASGRAPASPCQTSGGADTRDPERRAAPPPPSQVPAGLCTAADAPTAGPKKTRHPRQPCQSPSLKGQRRGRRGTRGAGYPGVPTARARNVGLTDDSHPKGTTPLAPNAGMSATHRCGAPEEAARREQASAGSQ